MCVAGASAFMWRCGEEGGDVIHKERAQVRSASLFVCLMNLMIVSVFKHSLSSFVISSIYLERL